MDSVARITKQQWYVILSGVGVIGLAVAGFYGYGFYNHYRNAQAQQIFSACVQTYQHEKTLGDKADWKKVDQELKDALKDYNSSSFAPYLYAYASNVALFMHDENAAVASMRDAVDHCTKTNPLYYLYQLKQALLDMSVSDKTVVQDGKKLLAQLVENTENTYRDAALFYQGYAAWVAGDMVEARRIWQILINTFGGQSTYVQLAHEKMAYER